MIGMSAKAKSQKKVRVGGTIDSDVADWLMKTRGREKFSKHLNNILRRAMLGSAGGFDLADLQDTLDTLTARLNTVQERVDALEAGKNGSPAIAKRPRGRPRKAIAAPRARNGGTAIEEQGLYDVSNDINWYLSHDRYKKIKPAPLINAFNMVSEKVSMGENLTVGAFKDEYDRSGVGVPYPTFRLFYFPLIRDRMLDKKILEKVDRPGKKGVYRKRT